MSSAEKRCDPGERAAGPAFECRSVTVEFLHKFSRKRIIEDISFLVQSGEFLTIVGPSGTGKTTLLRTMGGLTPTASGSVLVRGKELDGPPDDVVIVFQDYSNALLQWRTVAANVAFGIERALDRRETEQRVQDAATRQRLHEFFRSLPGDRFPTLAALGEHIWLDNRDQRFTAGINALIDGLERAQDPPPPS